MPRDPYEVLGVPRDADQETIKKAYRRLAMENHPDRNPGDHQAEERFKDIGRAYEILGDPGRRASFDRWGTPEGAPGMDMGFGLDDAIRSFMEAFGFGGMGGGRTRTRRRGEDVEQILDLTLQEAALGGSRTLQVRRAEPCPDCSGLGADPSAGHRQCPACGGAGRTRSSRRTLLGTFQSVETCEACGGEGRQAVRKCQSCRGSGTRIQERTISVDIPPGITEGYTVRLRNQGHAPGGADPGDLLLTVRSVDYGPFAREGDDLVYVLRLSIPEAALGVALEVPSVSGRPRRVEVRAGSQPGDTVLLRGEGMTRLRGGGRGDLRIRLDVHIPRRLSGSEKKMLSELADSKNFRVER